LWVVVVVWGGGLLCVCVCVLTRWGASAGPYIDSGGGGRSVHDDPEALEIQEGGQWVHI